MIGLSPRKGVEMLVQIDSLFSDSVIKSDMNVESARSAEGFVQLVRVISRGEEDRIFLDKSDHLHFPRICSPDSRHHRLR